MPHTPVHTNSIILYSFMYWNDAIPEGKNTQMFLVVSENKLQYCF